MTERQREDCISDDSTDILYRERPDIPLPKNNSKAILKKLMKTYLKCIKLLLNILWISLEDASYDKLQTNERLLVQLCVYLSSDMSIKNREKESLIV